MPTYAIGDIQGCFEALQRLLAQIGFDPTRDRVWLVGDLVNRGPQSLEVLRWARGLGASAKVVLGNHDLHLLAAAAGLRRPNHDDTFEAILKAPDREALLGWLRARPLLYREGRWLMVHAGLLPSWSLREAEARARALERRLRSGELAPVLADEATAAFTRLRMCQPDGCPDHRFTGPPEQALAGLVPWFQAPKRAWLRQIDTVLFGHWAALGHRRGPGWISLDSGCVWGGALTALRLHDRESFQQPALAATHARG